MATNENIDATFTSFLETFRMGAWFEELFMHPGGDELVITCSCGGIYNGDFTLALLNYLLDHLQQMHTLTMKRWEDGG